MLLPSLVVERISRRPEPDRGREDRPRGPDGLLDGLDRDGSIEMRACIWMDGSGIEGIKDEDRTEELR